MRRTLVNGGHKSQPTGRPPLNWPRLTPGFSFRGALRPINPEHANKLDLDADSRFVLSTSMGEAREIVSLPEARERGLIRYFTGKPCKRGHVDWRQTTSATCMACDRESYRARAEKRIPQMREYQEQNRALVRKASSAWKAQNPEKNRIHHFNRQRRLRGRGVITREELDALHARQKFRCAACGRSTRKKYHADHIQPIAKGGLNVIANIQILCPRCNHSKHAKDPLDWAREKGWLL